MKRPLDCVLLMIQTNLVHCRLANLARGALQKLLLDCYAVYPQRYMMSKDWRKETTRSLKLRKSVEGKLPVVLTGEQKARVLEWIAKNLDLASLG
jgi:hypothetical protein